MTPARRLLFYLPDLGGGGAERVMVNLANGFAARGYLVDMVLAMAGGVNLPFVSSTVQVVELDARGCLASVPALALHIRRVKPCALISTLRHANVAAVLAARAARVRGCSVIIREANTLIGSAGWPTLAPIRSALLPTAMRLTYRLADYAVANSEGVAEDLAMRGGMPRARVRVIENPIDYDALRRLAAEEVPDPWLGDPSVPVCLGVGRLAPQKDFADLIRAFGLVRRERPARLVILGEGEERVRLERLIAREGLTDDVRLRGYVANPYPYMKRCNCFVLSSRFEGSPNALIEAILLGARVVSTDCPWGPREVLEGGRLGSLVPVGDVGALASAIQGALKHTEGPDCAAALDGLRFKYSPESVISKYAQLFGGEG